jgi:transposase-like protein
VKFPRFADIWVSIPVKQREGTNMEDTRKKYGREFKIQAVRMLEEDRKSGQEIEKELESGQAERRTRPLRLKVGRAIDAFRSNGTPRDGELSRRCARK